MNSNYYNYEQIAEQNSANLRNAAESNESDSICKNLVAFSLYSVEQLPNEFITENAADITLSEKGVINNSE